MWLSTEEVKVNPSHSEVIVYRWISVGVSWMSVHPCILRKGRTSGRLSLLHSLRVSPLAESDLALRSSQSRREYSANAFLLPRICYILVCCSTCRLEGGRGISLSQFCFIFVSHSTFRIRWSALQLFLSVSNTRRHYNVDFNYKTVLRKTTTKKYK